MPFTRLGEFAGPRPVYPGTFDKSGGAPVSKGQVTRLGEYGGPRPPYGDFAPKTGGVIVVDIDRTIYRGMAANTGRLMNLT